jgi:hypothetical protein
MKRSLLAIIPMLSLLIAPAPAFALFNVNQGGTGQSTFTSGALIYGNGTNPLATTTPGTNGYVLQFNGSFPTWVSTSSLGIVTQPGGGDGQVQFNDGGSFGGSDIKWDKTTHLITVGSTVSGLAGGWHTISGGPLFVNSFVAIAGTLGLTDQGGIEWTSGAPGSGNRMSLYNDVAPNTLSLYRANGGGGGGLFLDIDNLTGAGATLTFPNLSGRVAVLEASQKWTGANTFDQGAVGTTTVNFGHMGSSTSHVCVNTKNTDGADISFYFVGTSMVVENNACQ